MKKLFASLTAMSLVLVACSGAADKPEKQRYIDANAEITCLIYKSADFSKLSKDELVSKTKDVFTKYGFNANDDKAMTAIVEKYKADAEVEAAVGKAIDNCAGDLKKSVDELKKIDSKQPTTTK